MRGGVRGSIPSNKESLSEKWTSLDGKLLHCHCSSAPLSATSSERVVSERESAEL